MFLQDEVTEPDDIACGRCKHLSISLIYFSGCYMGDSQPAVTPLSARDGPSAISDL